MATDWATTTKENLNFARLCRLLIGGGTRVLRHVFDTIHPPNTLHTVLHSTPVHTILKGLRAKRVLTVHQWDKLYPKTTAVTSGGFDIKLLSVLLRNICKLIPPPTGWGIFPADTDQSKEADLVRIKLYRNEVYGNITQTAVRDVEFEILWTRISALLIRLGGPHYKEYVDRLKVEPMDTEHLNFARLCRLLIDGGTRVLRHVFDTIHSPSTLHTVLHSTPVHNLLKYLKGRVLKVHQWDKLYPRTTVVTSGGFDITLLSVLLRNICNLTPPPTGWDKPPADTDQSKEADLVRIKLYRNELYGNITQTAVSDAEFEKLWTEISAVLVRLGGQHYKPDIDRLKVEPMDIDYEKYFMKVLEETEKSIKTAIENQEQQVMEKLRDLEENVVVLPEVIIARGPNAEKAYQQAIKEGKIQVYRGRIMLIGQDRAGKTSLKKSLLGLRFDPQEPSTEGVDVDPSRFSVDVDSAIEWKKLEETPINNFDDYIARVTAEKLNNQTRELGEPEPDVEPEPEPDVEHEPEPVAEENEQENNELAHDDIQDLGGTYGGAETPTTPDVPDGVSDDSNSSKDDVEPTREKDEFQIAEGPSEEVTERIIQYLNAKKIDEISPEDKVTVSIWDFAGQQLYYASHPVFFSPRAVYLLVYNLNKDLKEKATPCVRQGIYDIKLDNHEKQTNLEAILSWLVSVHSIGPQDDGKSKEDDELPYLRPPVVIVGTHADRPFEDVRKMEVIIQKSLSEKSYEKHVVNFIAVNNVKSSDDEGVQKLRNQVNELFKKEPYMEEYVPVRWFRFEKVIKSLVNEKGIHHLPLEELEKVVLEVCHIENQDEIEAMLNFYHDLGDIVKYGKTVVLKAEWLIDVFKRLITIRPYNEQNSRLRKYWKELEKKGVLDMELVSHVFKDLIGRQGSRTQKDILEMMTEYGLIAKFGTENNFHYFVPAQLQSSPTEPLDSKLKASDPCALYIHFPDGFIPHGLYYYLVSKVIGWCSESKYLEEPKLHKNVSQFGIGCSQEYKLQLICRKAFIKVVLSSRQPERSLDFKPAFKVRKKLEDCLEEMKNKCHGYGSITYKICVRCPQCATSDSDDDCLPLLRVTKDPKNPAKLVLICRNKMHDEVPDVPGLDLWYRDPTTVHPQVEVSSTLKLHDKQKRWLVIGISLNVVLLPPLREFMKTKMGDHYCTLKTNHNIDNQVFHGQLTREGKCNNLNYRSINNNDAVRGERNYDYKVQTAVDLAKLYLLPHMAKFKDFDESCDTSAVLGILCSASVFSSDVQDYSKDVRQELRNEWAHCNFSVWDETRFETCFQLMDSLLKALNLSPDDEKTIDDKLKDWKEKGVELCTGNKVKAESVKVLEENVAQLCCTFQRLASNGKDEALIVLNALQPVQEAIDECKKEIESLKQRMGKCEEECKKIVVIEKRVEALESAAKEQK